MKMVEEEGKRVQARKQSRVRQSVIDALTASYKTSDKPGRSRALCRFRGHANNAGRDACMQGKRTVPLEHK